MTDVDATIAAMKIKNVKVTTEPRGIRRAPGDLRVALIEDPSGVRIELVRR